MSTLSGMDALAWANGQSTWPPGMCLNFVWNAFGAPVTSPAGGYGNALAGWDNTQQQHPGSRNAPNGCPVYFSGPDGHVAIMKDTTRGLLRSTYTSGGAGLVGDITIDTILTSWGRQLLGWGSDIFGYQIDTAGTAGGGSTPIAPDVQTLDLRMVNSMFRIVPHYGSQPLEYWLYGITGKRVQIGSPDHLTLLRRFDKEALSGGTDQMYSQEGKTIMQYLASVNK